MGHEEAHDRVSGFVECGDLLFVLGNDLALAGGSCDKSVDRLEHLALADLFLVAAGGENGRLVDQVREVCAAETGGLLGEVL